MSANNEIEDDNCEASCALNSWVWNVPQVIMEDATSPAKYAVVILNRPITQHLNFIKKLWNSAALTMTVDGGTLRWDRFLASQTETVRNSFKKPDAVTGDFDSINEEILDKYSKNGCKIISTPDQDYTDFTKALLELNILSNKKGVKLDYIVTICQGSGRMDHTLGNIQTLFLARDKSILNPHTRLYLVSDDALTWLLNPGEHSIKVPESTRKHKQAWCGLIPIGESCKTVTTTGLKWNLDHHTMQYGGLISTSNEFTGTEEVTVQCSHALLWTMKVPCLTKPSHD